MFTSHRIVMTFTKINFCHDELLQWKGWSLLGSIRVLITIKNLWCIFWKARSQNASNLKTNLKSRFVEIISNPEFRNSLKALKWTMICIGIFRIVTILFVMFLLEIVIARSCNISKFYSDCESNNWSIFQVNLLVFIS